MFFIEKMEQAKKDNLILNSIKFLLNSFSKENKLPVHFGCNLWVDNKKNIMEFLKREEPRVEFLSIKKEEDNWIIEFNYEDKYHEFRKCV